MSAETTFDIDIADVEALKHELWPLCEKVSERLKRAGLAGGNVHLKLKTAGFRIVSRQMSLNAPTQLAETLFRCGRALLEKEATDIPYRLIGIGVGDIRDAAAPTPPTSRTPTLRSAARSRPRSMQCAPSSARAASARDAGSRSSGADRRLAMMDDRYDLQRFVDAQTPVYDRVRAELKHGRKHSHWMWFIFPQVAGSVTPRWRSVTRSRRCARPRPI